MTDTAATAVCARHPDRATSLVCTRCSRPACPGCLVPAAVGFHCVDCLRVGHRDVAEARVASDRAHGRDLRGVVRPGAAFFVLIGAFVASCVWAWGAHLHADTVVAIPFGDKLPAIAMVITGWMLSLTLHEFGHAVTAYWAGDRSVVDKGYLTLDVRRYVHPVLSIVLPVLIVLSGGIGLPGGAVWIRPGAMRSRAARSLVSFAGPFANIVCAVVILGAARLTPRATMGDHTVFFSALTFLGSLQVTAVLINLLPIPGLDGFGVIQPWLPPSANALVRQFGQYSMFILYLLLFQRTPVSTFVWTTHTKVIDLLGHRLDAFAALGRELLRFGAGL